MNSENSRGRRHPAGDVGGDGTGQHDPAAAGRALQEAPHGQPAGRRRERAQHRRERADQGRADEQPAASAGVRKRPQHQLAHDEADDVRGQSELHRRLARTEVGGQFGKRRQVQGHRQRAERGEAAEEESPR
jgi:hypothetical protein